MTIVPFLLDARPNYLAQAERGSLLLFPGPDGALVRDLVRAVAAVTAHPPAVLPAFAPDARYDAELRAACPEIETVVTPQRFGDVIGDLELSDVLLFISPSRYPADGLDLRELCRGSRDDARMVRHLLAFEATSNRSKEFVQAADDGRVRRVQRYFEPVTWPFAAGVMASFVPVACVRMSRALPVSSLDDMRRVLAGGGIPSRDLPYHGESFDLGDEAGGLALSERRLANALVTHEARRPRSPATSTLRSPGAIVHETARLIGPVYLGAGAVVNAGALIIGPAVIGDGACVEADAIVAHSLLFAGATVASAVTVRQRIVVDRAEGDSGIRQRRHSVPARAARASDVEKRGGHLDYVMLKAALDRIAAVVALVVLAPLMALIALAVRVSSSGPVFFGDNREGKDGRPFRCWKFRSMRTNADAMQRALAAQQQMDGPQFKMDADPRVTTIGRWLRRLNVDELPQLWNVARGEMSFVGPRPSPFRENQICVPWRYGRLSVRPGITGLWQVCRHDRALGDFHQWIYYDLLYVRNLSFLLDLKIFTATILTLGGRWPVPLVRMLGRRAHGITSETPSLAIRNGASPQHPGRYDASVPAVDSSSR
jgi:lipopolysaccharide/colanic/teichoic acid biosynthesis glycosyltransferase